MVILRLPKQLYLQWKEQSEEYLNLPQGANDGPTETLLWPPSRCSECEQAIKPWHNIPVLSYILLKGRCATCSTPISLQYPLVELFTGIVVATTAYYYGAQLNAIYALFFTVMLIALAGIDVKEKLLPDQITLPLLWVGLIANLNDFFVPLSEAVIGATAGYLVLWSVYWVFRLITGKEGMGYGDFKLLAVFGALLGWQSLLTIILLSSVVGAIIGIALLSIQGKDKATPIPFGPYLAIAGWITMLWGNQIQGAYFNLIGY